MKTLFDPDRLADTAADSLAKDLGQLAQLEARLAELREQLAGLPESAGEHERAGVQIEIARALQVLGRGAEAWPLGRLAFDAFATAGDWEHAADACDVLYQAEQEGSLAALGQGIWLGVTFPIDPEISVHLLSHVVDDTPDDADGAAVAAATAAFLADLRAPRAPTATGWCSSPTSCSGRSRGGTARWPTRRPSSAGSGASSSTSRTSFWCDCATSWTCSCRTTGGSIATPSTPN